MTPDCKGWPANRLTNKVYRIMIKSKHSISNPYPTIKILLQSLTLCELHDKSTKIVTKTLLALTPKLLFYSQHKENTKAFTPFLRTCSNKCSIQLRAQHHLFHKTLIANQVCIDSETLLTLELKLLPTKKANMPSK